MTRSTYPSNRLAALNGSALLTLVASLLIATWPFFGTFTTAAVAAGLALAVAMDSWNRRHPSTQPAPPSAERLPAEINLASIPVRGDGGGLIFAVGSVAILLGLPALRWFLLASVACAVLVACALIAWRHARSLSPRCELSIASH